MANMYVPWSSNDDMWHGQSGPGIACDQPVELACGGEIGLDYGGNPSYTDSDGNEVSCGFAPIVVIYADHEDWQAPGWYSGAVTYDASMDSALECQDRCFLNADCDYFSCKHTRPLERLVREPTHRHRRPQTSGSSPPAACTTSAI